MRTSMMRPGTTNSPLDSCDAATCSLCSWQFCSSSFTLASHNKSERHHSTETRADRQRQGPSAPAVHMCYSTCGVSPSSPPPIPTRHLARNSLGRGGCAGRRGTAQASTSSAHTSRPRRQSGGPRRKPKKSRDACAPKRWRRPRLEPPRRRASPPGWPSRGAADSAAARAAHAHG